MFRSTLTIIREYIQLHYSRYVDDIIIIFNTHDNSADIILQQLNNLNKNLQFQLSTEKNNCISFLDLNIIRTPHNINLGIYRKETSTDTTIHNTSNHPYEYTMAAYRFYIHRLRNLPLTDKEKMGHHPKHSDKQWLFSNTYQTNVTTYDNKTTKRSEKCRKQKHG